MMIYKQYQFDENGAQQLPVGFESGIISRILLQSYHYFLDLLLNWRVVQQKVPQIHNIWNGKL